MFGLCERGVAVVSVLVTVVISTGAGMSTPVVVDAADVDPDSPFYGLERLGERIRLVGDVDQMKERCIEAYRMHERGKAERYRPIFEEFVDKAEYLVDKPDIAEWVREHEIEVSIVVDVHDVLPDHVLYRFENLGERIRGIGTKDLVKERCIEAYEMYGRGKAERYRPVFEEFVDRAEDLIDEPDIAEWVREHESEVSIVVDVCDVLPDHVLYQFENRGELIRGIGAENLVKERWEEYREMVDKGKGSEYKQVLQEFVEKMKEVAPGDVEARLEVVQWMQEQMPGIGLVKLKLMKELCEELKVDLENLPEVAQEIENEIEVLEELELEIPVATPEVLENIRARLRLIRERVRNIVENLDIERPEVPVVRKRVGKYFGIDNLLIDVDVTIDVEVEIVIKRPIPALEVENKFEEELEKFDETLAEIRAMLEGTPENAPGRRAVERLIKVAMALKDNALDAERENMVRKALALIRAAQVHLRNAETILDHASEWEPEFKDEWAHWVIRWENLKLELEREGIYEEVIRSPELIESKWEEIKEIPVSVIEEARRETPW